MSYKAFISYSHKEHGKQAARVQQALSRFASPWYKRRRLRLFLDDANLPASPSLWDAIEEALNASEYLIVLASPAAAKSVWCEKEIQYWIKDKPPETIILVLLSGVIEWNSNTNDFDWNKTDSLPKSFKGVFSSEPRFVDLKNTDLLTQHKDLTTRNKFAEIVSVLLNLPKDELIGEDIRLYRRTLKLAWGGMAILAVTSILATRRQSCIASNPQVQKTVQ